MKTNNILPSELTLDQIQQRFSTDEAAREYIESVLWPHGPVCPHCKNAEQKSIWKIEANKEKKIRAGLRQCAKCKNQFTVTIGTVFEDSHIPLRKWLTAWYLLCSSKKGISSLQLQRNLGLGSYRAALFMTHRIRHALKDSDFGDKLFGSVEVDETYVGGKKTGVGRGCKCGKTPVVSLLERDGRVRSQVMHHVTGSNLKQAIRNRKPRRAVPSG
jgi:transposase-like protein